MRDACVGSLVVVSNDQPVGMVTDRDLVVRVMARGLEAGGIPVSEAMSDKPVFISDSRDISHALDMMREMNVRRIPVVDDKQNCVGVVTLDDVVSALAFEMGGVSEVIRVALRR